MIQKITLDNAGRRYNRDWVFRNINYTFETSKSYAILGPNGSGKSTLLQLIAGSLIPSEGNVSYWSDGTLRDSATVYNSLSLAAPYLDLIEEFTLAEMIDFHFGFKSYAPGLNHNEVIALLGFQHARSRQIRNYSSGMKQRVKLALAFGTDAAILLLDEPASNLDQQGLEWYKQLIGTYSRNRMLIICSNQPEEYDFCRDVLQVSDYKPI